MKAAVRPLLAGGLLVVALALVPNSRAAAPTTKPIASGDLQFFETKIRPLLAEKCYKCHSQQSDKVRGGLLLDTREATVAGGNTGPAVVPGKPDESLLIQAVRYKDEDLQMPPKGEKLSDQEIADLTEWVRRGAPDPRARRDRPCAVSGSSRCKSRRHPPCRIPTGARIPSTPSFWPSSRAPV